MPEKNVAEKRRLACVDRVRVYTDLEDCGEPVHGEGPYCMLHGRARLLLAVERLAQLERKAVETRSEIEQLQRQGYPTP